jgi:alginate export protein
MSGKGESAASMFFMSSHQTPWNGRASITIYSRGAVMGTKRAFQFVFILFVILLSANLWAADSPFSWGGDLRARVVSFDRIPTEAGMIWSEQQFFRFRTRLWGRYAFSPDISFTSRLSNEWREYAPDKGTNKYQPLDEVVFDNIYLDVNNLFDNHLDLRIGRQDLQYGTRKIICIGTPFDSSRTYYFNAIKATLSLAPLQIDFLALHVNDEDELAINSQDRRLVEGEEYGGGMYIKNSFFSSVPQEYYYLYKHEQRSQNLNLHTVGLRFMPEFSRNLSVNLEMAMQGGHRQNGGSVAGELFDLSVFYTPSFWQNANPRFDLSYYYLSGDDPNSVKEEGWHQLWARFPQYMSYILVRAQVPDFAAWSNISMPSAGLAVDVNSHLNLKLRVSLAYAPEDGPGGGNKKGSLFITRLSYKINRNWRGNIHLELMDPDDYYANTDGYAHYGHMELAYHF